MATTKRDFTDPQVQGHTLDMREARARLGESERGVTRFLREYNISTARLAKSSSSVRRSLRRRWRSSTGAATRALGRQHES